jgi:phage terminase large subunit GpA-like protein
MAERTAWYECPACKKKIDNSEKLGMMRLGVWAEAGTKIPKDFNGKVYFTPGKYKTRIHMHLSSLYSPLLSWGACASEFIRCMDKQHGNIGLQNFINSWLAEAWSPKVREYRWEDLKKIICATHTQGFVPPWVRFITAGVDIQKGWGVYVVRGWGIGGRSSLISLGQFTSVGELEGILFEQKYKQDGKVDPVGVILAGIDTGYKPYDIYLWSKTVNMKHGECVRCIKGHDKGAPYWMTVLDRSGFDGKAIPGGVQLWNISDYFWKSFLVSKYEIPVGRPGSWEVPADVDDVYMRSITSESLQEKKDKRTGKTTREWVVTDTTIGNHFLDAEKIAACMADMCGWDETEEEAVRPERQERDVDRRDDEGGGDFLGGTDSFMEGR